RCRTRKVCPWWRIARRRVRERDISFCMSRVFQPTANELPLHLRKYRPQASCGTVLVDWDMIQGGRGSLAEALMMADDDRQTAGPWAAELIADRGLMRSKIIKRSRLNQTFAYQILSGDRRASRDKLIQLAFGMGLTIAECSELLERGGVNALSPHCRRDIAIAYCLDRGLDVALCDDILWDLGEQTLVPGEERATSEERL
ncbi:MAG: hypothetical protein IKE22_01425, partial [Atopobiaceae bacterium]|nr:hypothetical protein [Atopobiaceae bacterium]